MIIKLGVFSLGVEKSKISFSKMEKVNVQKWIEENKSAFLPPVCNKLMHFGQVSFSGCSELIFVEFLAPVFIKCFFS